MTSSHNHKTGRSSATSFPQDPTYTGPGIWFMLHLKSYHATTYSKAILFIEDLWLLAENHPCPVCRRNMTAYLQDNPPQEHIEYYEESGRNIGMFRYMWLFHNYKNAELGKPTMSFEMAIQQFEDPSQEEGPCTEGCGHNDISAEDLIAEYNGIPMPSSERDGDRPVSPGVRSFFTVKPSVIGTIASPSVSSPPFITDKRVARRPYYGQ